MQKYNCKECGGELYWSSDKTALACDYCGAVFSVSEYEHDTEYLDAVVSNEAHSTDGSVSHHLVEYSCEVCGAKIVTAAGTVSTACAYCGRAITVTNEFAVDFNPDVIIPFRVNKENVKYIYQQYLKKNRLRKKIFSNVDFDKVLHGIYVPCWLHTFDIECEAGLEGKKYITARGADGRQEYFSDKFFLDVWVESVFDNIPIDALSNIKDELVHGVEPFN
jgi:DNA-directed RNA polymerase subunit RPC12/RpoP